MFSMRINNKSQRFEEEEEEWGRLKSFTESLRLFNVDIAIASTIFKRVKTQEI